MIDASFARYPARPTSPPLRRPGELPLAAGSWTIDPVHSVVQFSVRHLGISTRAARLRWIVLGNKVGITIDAQLRGPAAD